MTSKHYFILSALLLVLSFNLSARQNFNQIKADSLLNIINQDISDSITLVSSIDIAERYYRLRKMDSALLYAQKSFDMANELDIRKAAAYRILGYVKIMRNEMEEAKEVLWQGRKLAEESSDTSSLVLILTHLASAYLYNTTDSCIYYAVEALNLTKDPRRIVTNMRIMALANHRSGNLEKAIEIQKDAIKIAQDNPGTVSLLHLKYNLAGFYFKIDLDSARALYQEVYEDHVSSGNIAGQLHVMVNLASIEYYKGNHQKAIELNLKILEERRKNKVEGDGKDTVYKNLAINYRILGKLNLAYKYLDSARAMIFMVNDNPAIDSYYAEKFKLDSTANNFGASIKTLKTHMAFKDSIRKKGEQEKYAELQTKYETAKKDQEIANLTQQSEIQSLTIGKRNNQIIAGAAVVALIVFIGLFYHRQSKSKQEKAANELQQRFLRSQLNPHFIFNSMTAIQQYVLEYDAQGASDYMGMFSTLMRQILENSRQEFIPLSEEKSMLTNYLELQKLRFKGAFDYTIEIDEDLDEDYLGIPPMFAQPFIENSLEHGLFKKGDEVNEIKIKFSQGDDDLIKLEIEDNGIGNQQKTDSNGHKSLSTIITSERLNSMNKSANAKIGIDTFNIENESGDILGYKINLTLPSRLVIE